MLAANVKAAEARKAARKVVEPPPGTCRELGCTEASLPDQPYCSVHTLVGKVPELGDEPRPKAVERETHPCNRCGAGIPDARCTSICDECAAPAPGKLPKWLEGKCHRCHTEINGNAPYCAKCRVLPDKCEMCNKNPRGWAGNMRNPKVCYDCLQLQNGAKARAKQETKARIDQELDEIREHQFKPEDGRVELARGVDNDGITRQITGIKGNTVKPKAVKWLWKDKIPANAITWGFGTPGSAKSLFSMELAAIVSTGRDFPDGTPNTMGAKQVIIYNAEDSVEETIVPRLMAHRANLSNITLLDEKSFRDFTGTEVTKRSFDLTQDIPLMAEAIKQNPDITLLVVDPITGVFGGKDVNKDKEVVKVLENLKALL